MIIDNNSLFSVIVLFGIYSCFGWVIETVYRSLLQRGFVNAGFLFGPFVPIYGFGAALLVSLDSLIGPWPLPLKIMAYGVSLTTAEYVAGFALEKIFNLKLWDYSNNKFNLHGRICLQFSVYWTALVSVFMVFVHPFVLKYVQALDILYLRAVALAFMTYLIMDLSFSVISMTSFKKKIAYLYSEYFNLSNSEIERIFSSFERLRNAFPNLSRHIDNTINEEIKNKISEFLKTIPDRAVPRRIRQKPVEGEFFEIIRDIYQHEEVLKLKEHFHHNSSIYQHVMDVSYFSYRACKFLKLDYHSAARGALLHDFFLYDWRNRDITLDKYHGIEHPKIALKNAGRHFILNDIEKDIIIKHMWPLTLVPPKYKESFVVSFVDKYLASREMVIQYKQDKIQKREDKKAGVRTPRKRRKIKLKSAHVKTDRHKISLQ